MSRIRAIFLGTPDFAKTCLEGLIRDEHFEVVGVVTQPDRPAGRHLKLTPSPVKSLVQPLGIPVLSPPTVNQADVLSTLASWRAEVAIVVAFGQIMSSDFLNLFPQKVVNIHTSLLPRWRGAAPIQRALMAGDPETGVSLQVMVKKLDAGGLLGVRKIKISEEVNSTILHEQLKPLACELLSLDLMDYLRGNLSPVEQDDSCASYAAKIEKREAEIHWHQPAQHIANLIRGLSMGPHAYCHRGNRILKIHQARVLNPEVNPERKKTGSSEPSWPPGQILTVEKDSFVVSCGLGTRGESTSLEVFEVQPESKPRMKVVDYLLGHPLRVGESFNSH